MAVRMAVRLVVRSWQSLLEEAHLTGVAQGGIEAFMQDFFPGPYSVEEYYDAKLGRFNYRLKFEDPKQETIWRIKYP